jgi:TonB family protein
MKVRRAEPLPRQAVITGVVGTATVHVALAALMVLTALLRPAARGPIVYSVELVAAPAQVRPPTRAVPPAPAPAPAPTVSTKPAPAKTAPVPKPKAPPKVDPKAEPVRTPAAAQPPNPGATPGTGTDVENVRVEGVAFPFPEYLRNIMNQIFRRWARPVGVSLSAEVSFTILRDGTVRNIKVTRSSRVYSFDLEAQGAVEQAGADGAFGPLPQGWPTELLNVAFLFTPRPR